MTGNEFGMIKSHIERQMDQIIYLIPVPLYMTFILKYNDFQMTHNEFGMIKSHIERQTDQIIYLIPLPLYMTFILK